ncbi:hypothetical protein CEXT_627461 [Caerostris extrusa]|uniref:Uncharacterized protein n=1 Tax=Caerostris extrusa TaxID=172846 RepID=A0AAV4MF81_CAEEX|nr:hypothetical protein CEXT_627461 [Caerostris extrusa]
MSSADRNPYKTGRKFKIKTMQINRRCGESQNSVIQSESIVKALRDGICKLNGRYFTRKKKWTRQIKGREKQNCIVQSNSVFGKTSREEVDLYLFFICSDP